MTKRRARAAGLTLATILLFALQTVITICRTKGLIDIKDASEIAQRIFICIVVLITGTQIILAMDDD